MGDFILVLGVKLFIVFFGNYLLFKWINRKRTILKLIVCWFISFFLNFYQAFTIYDGILQNFFVDSTNLLRTSESLGSLAALLSIFTFFILGIILFKKR